MPNGVALVLVILVVWAGAFPVLTATAQTTSPIPPSPPFDCGWHTGNSSKVVATSPPGSEVTVSVSYPSWGQACFSFGPSGVSFPSYEVFPITISAPPHTNVTLRAGRAVPTPQQVTQVGVRNTTIWTQFDPATVTTNSAGVAKANFTLVGAVMPFVANDIANVSLPIQAEIQGGASASAGLPIEFLSISPSGVTILQTPGPITFEEASEGAGSNTQISLVTLVYSPPNGTRASPIQITLNVLGSYRNGSVGPMPAGVQLSFPQPTFELQPDSVFYLQVDPSNSLKPTNTALTENFANYTLAVQEKVGDNTFVEPLAVSINLNPPIALGAFSPVPRTSQVPAWSLAGIAAVIAAVVVVFAVTYNRQEGPEAEAHEEKAIAPS
jgi:hypothetical protein